MNNIIYFKSNLFHDIIYTHDDLILGMEGPTPTTNLFFITYDETYPRLIFRRVHKKPNSCSINILYFLDHRKIEIATL